ncbi:hypothetical protein, unlikely [Trypanosoma brucei brucei TREU927]|uniref:Uncharacterized protein n=1 Tax=Trypanosoma brucei brucei (strain 927/4 GUTat10.1) TaxID=185431 RepID=Q4GYJ0_TRYB2|nr:hypothetical protein, unlikely [Trypanosoma brucei brucei TREU927]CAJ16594.1 hypothetical protein, unlikely [Trypanosoma brucei brucei TREU927]
MCVFVQLRNAFLEVEGRLEGFSACWCLFLSLVFGTTKISGGAVLFMY